MTEIRFMTSDSKAFKIKCDLKDKLEKVCKIFAFTIHEKYGRLFFFKDGKEIDKNLTVSQFKKNKKSVDFIMVKIMEIDIENDPKEEKASIELKKKIIDEIKNQDKNITYEDMQELVVQYGYDCEKKIEQEIKKDPENFIEPKEAIKQKDSDEKIFILGKLGESLENMGIKVIIDKKNISNNDDYIINNQIISSGILKNTKYEIHVEENDNTNKYLILNDEIEQNKFIKKWKEIISNEVGIPKEDICITNLREGSLTFDTLFKKVAIKKLKGKSINIDEKMKKFANYFPKIKKIFLKNILGACILSPDMLDPEYNQYPGNWAKPPAVRGGMEYFPPTDDWVGYGLKVLDLYDNKNNDWIGMDGNENEWAVAYHGTSTAALKPVCKQNGKFYSTIEEGAINQKCCDYKNIHEKSNKIYEYCGEGTYCSPHLEYAEIYSKGVIIMCRVNPKLIRIPEGKFSEKEWITDGTKKTIRPYRILYKL